MEILNVLLQATGHVAAPPTTEPFKLIQLKDAFETTVAAIVIFSAIIALVRWLSKRIKAVKAQIDTNYINPFNKSVEALRTHVEESQKEMQKRWDETDKLLAGLVKGYGYINQMKEDIRKISGEIVSSSGGSIKDRTEQIQKDVSILNDTMNAMLSIDSNAIMVVNSNGECTKVNQEWLLLSGFSSKELAIGHGWYNAVHPEDRDMVIEQWQDCVKSSTLFICNFRVQNVQTGKISFVASKASSTKDHLGKVLNSIVVFFVKNR